MCFLHKTQKWLFERKHKKKISINFHKILFKVQCIEYCVCVCVKQFGYFFQVFVFVEIVLFLCELNFDLIRERYIIIIMYIILKERRTKKIKPKNWINEHVANWCHKANNLIFSYISCSMWVVFIWDCFFLCLFKGIETVVEWNFFYWRSTFLYRKGFTNSFLYNSLKCFMSADFILI